MRLAANPAAIAALPAARSRFLRELEDDGEENTFEVSPGDLCPVFCILSLMYVASSSDPLYEVPDSVYRRKVKGVVATFMALGWGRASPGISPHPRAIYRGRSLGDCVPR